MNFSGSKITNHLSITSIKRELFQKTYEFFFMAKQ